MENVAALHEMIFAHLLKKYREEDPGFKFTTRVTNRYSRLDKGYWFHGNDYYLAFSFWTGTDWMNKTSNIMFSTDFEECYLEISVWDSDVKRQFVDDVLMRRIKDLTPGGKYHKYLGSLAEEDITVILDRFINTDKRIIDRAIEENEDLLLEDDNAIWFIDEDRFEWSIKKINEYRLSTIGSKWIKGYSINDKPYTIRSINIQSFGEIKNLHIEDIPEGNQCIFLTGENGTGKTTILRAIGAALISDHKHVKGNYSIELMLSNSEMAVPIAFSPRSIDGSLDLLRQGYAAYGPHRLMTYAPIFENTLRTEHGANDSLFENNIPLLNIETALITDDPTLNATVMKRRREIIEEVIGDIIPNFNGILWSGDGETKSPEPTRYKIGYPSDDNTESRQVKSYLFDELATGARSVLGMIGDMMVRLFLSQPKHIEDVGELRGIVLIDEIDIHLHPTFQKLLVAQLAATFPKVQFVISTHSPIPLLGAPENSVFYVVKKDYQHSISMERIDDVHVKNLTPDTILTSPIFGMQDILHADYDYDYDNPGSKSFKEIRTEASWDGIQVADAELRTLLSKYHQRKGGADDQSR